MLRQVLGRWLSRLRAGKLYRSPAGNSFLSRCQRSWRLKRLSRTSVLCLAGVIFFGGTMIFGYRVLRTSDIFLLTELNIYGNVMTTRQQIMNLGGLTLGISLLGLDLEEVAERIASHAWIDRVELERYLPSALEIRVHEHVPLALANMEHEGKRQLYYLDRQGKVFAPVEPGQNLDLPVLTGEGLDTILSEAQDDENDATGLKEAVLELLHLAASGNAVFPIQIISEIHLDRRDGLTLFLVDTPFPIHVGRDDIREKYRRLVKLLGWYYRKDGMEGIRRIDMEYAKDRVLVAGMEQ